MSKEHVIHWRDQHPEIQTVQTAIVDLNGIFRGKRLPANQIHKILDGTLRLPLSTCHADIWGDDITGSPLVFETGDVDGVCQWTGRLPLPTSWTARPSALLPVWLMRDSGEPFLGDPRQVLAEVVRGFAAIGLCPVVATELEFYLLDDSGDTPQPPISPLTGRPLTANSMYSIAELDEFDAFLADVYQAAQLHDIPIDAAIAEVGPGQFEVNLVHSADALKAADDTLYFKRLVRGLARRHGMAATFMAKPFAECAGNGMHVHFSLLDQDGHNVFDDGTAQGSNLLRQALAGVLATLHDFTPLFAPHLNSYRRLRPHSHAPTRITWGYENRTAALRIPGGSHQARRIEHRVAGGDTNPYLVIAGILAGALHGIARQLTPPPASGGDTYATGAQNIPTQWKSALDTFQHSQLVRDLLPPLFVDLFVRCKQQEYRVFADRITPFEYTTYLETV